MAQPASANSLRLSIEATTVEVRETSDLQTPTLISPPDTKSPPTIGPKREEPSGLGIGGDGRASTPVDAGALSRALSEEVGRHREHTPGASPRRKRQRIYGDRLVIHC